MSQTSSSLAPPPLLSALLSVDFLGKSKAISLPSLTKPFESSLTTSSGGLGSRGSAVGSIGSSRQLGAASDASVQQLQPHNSYHSTLPSVSHPYSAKKDFELLLWLALFAVSRVHPSMQIPTAELELSRSFTTAGGTPAATSEADASSGSEPTGTSNDASLSGGALHPQPTNHEGKFAAMFRRSVSEGVMQRKQSTVLFDFGGTVVDDADGEDDSSAHYGGSHTSSGAHHNEGPRGDAILPMSKQHCVFACRCLRGMLPGVAKHLNITPDSLLRWVTSPQQFGAQFKKREEILRLPPERRVRRDAPVREWMIKMLAEPSVLWYLWYHGGLLKEVKAQESFQPQEPRGSAARMTFSVANHNASFSDVQSTVSISPSAGGSPFSRGTSMFRKANFRSASLISNEQTMHDVELMCRQLLELYLYGAIDASSNSDTMRFLIDKTAQLTCFDERFASISTSWSACILPEQNVPRRGLPSRVQVSPAFSRMRTVHISKCALINIDSLLDCPLLEEIVLSRNRIRSLPAGFFTKLSFLKELRVDSNCLEEIIDPSDVIVVNKAEGQGAIVESRKHVATAQGSKLTVLDVSFNELTQAAIDCFFLCRFASASLTSLNLSGNSDIRTLPPPCDTPEGVHKAFPHLNDLALRQNHRLDPSMVERFLAPPSTGSHRSLTVKMPCIPCERVHNPEIFLKKIGGNAPWTLKKAVKWILCFLYIGKEIQKISIRRFLQWHQGTLMHVAPRVASFVAFHDNAPNNDSEPSSPIGSPLSPSSFTADSPQAASAGPLSPVVALKRLPPKAQAKQAEAVSASRSSPQPSNGPTAEEMRQKLCAEKRKKCKVSCDDVLRGAQRWDHLLRKEDQKVELQLSDAAERSLRRYSSRRETLQPS